MRSLLLAALAVALTAQAAPAYGAASQSRENGAQAAATWRSATWRVQWSGAWPASPGFGACPSTCNPWRRAVLWHQRYVAWRPRLEQLRHGSQSQCYALITRRFPAWVAPTVRAIATRESHCTWSAQNPSSTAAGAFQYLDWWGPLYERRDLVWSVNTAYHVWLQTGRLCPWQPNALC